MKIYVFLNISNSLKANFLFWFLPMQNGDEQNNIKLKKQEEEL